MSQVNAFTARSAAALTLSARDNGLFFFCAKEEHEVAIKKARSRYFIGVCLVCKVGGL